MLPEEPVDEAVTDGINILNRFVTTYKDWSWEYSFTLTDEHKVVVRKDVDGNNEYLFVGKNKNIYMAFFYVVNHLTEVPTEYLEIKQ